MVKAVATIEANRMSIIQPIDDKTLPWLGTFIGLPVLGFYVWCNTQTICQRILGARDVNHARWGALLGGLLKLPILFLLIIPGLFAFTLFPELENSDLAFAEIVSKLLPPGVIGFVLAGVIAAIMSSVDSVLNASSTLIVLDFIQPRRPELSPQEIARLGTITTIVLMIVAAVWTPVISNFKGIFDYVQIVLSFIVPPIVTVFLLGVFWSKGTAKGAKYTLILGHCISFLIGLLYFLGYLGGLHFTIIAGLLTLISFVIYFIFSFLSEPIDKKYLSDLTWKYRNSANETLVFSWYNDYRILATIVTITTLILLFNFW